MMLNTVVTILLIAGAVPQAASQYKGYPEDEKYHSVKTKFDHPYPVVQESGDYDKDYVKDENNDNGEWKAQMEYDRLRAKITEAKKGLPGLEDAAAAAQREYDEAEKEMQKVEKEIKEDEPIEEMEDEEKEEEEVEEEEKLEEEVKVPELELPPKPEITISSKEVEEAIAHLKECEQQMKDAKEKLMKVLDERDTAKVVKQNADEAKEEAEKEYDTAKKATEEAEAKVKSAQEEFDKAEAQYKKEVKDVEELEAELEKAAVKIRKIRAGVDDKGGIYQSGAHPSVSITFFALIAVCLAALRSQ